MPTIAVIQEQALPTIGASWERSAARIEEAADRGAQIVCTQELFLTPYFCKTQDPGNFELAETIPGPTTKRLQVLAKSLGIVIVASLFERRNSGLYHNTAVVVDADGTLAGTYRKTHIPQDPGFEEKFYFAPGDTGFPVWKTQFGTLGVLICWDQWFPESARLLALKGAEILFCPTAIGWLPGEKQATADGPASAWETVQKGQAVANACYYAAVNRVGREGDTDFWGRSFITDFYGKALACADEKEEVILYADCDLHALEAHRRIWPFFRDRRPEMYQGLFQLGE